MTYCSLCASAFFEYNHTLTSVLAQAKINIGTVHTLLDFATGCVIGSRTRPRIFY